MAKTTEPKIPYITWRRGKPRFTPSPTLRAMGYESKDLKAPSGEWMTEAEARLWSSDFARELASARAKPRRGRPKVAAPRPAPTRDILSVAGLMRDWLNPTENPDIADLRPNTLRYYRQRLETVEAHAPDIWHSPAEALDKPICLGLYDKLRIKVGLHSANGSLRILGIGLQWGMDRGRLPSMLINPAHKLKMKSPPPRVRFATKEEVAHFVGMADSLGRPEVGDMITLAVWSGQRQQDRLVLSLLNRAGGRIKLRQEKTRAIVSMPEAPELRRRLEASLDRRKTAEIISPYVILNERCWEPFKEDYYRHLFDDVRRAAAKTMPSLKGLRDQDLRDTAVTWLAMAGCTIPEICAITGHTFASATGILKHYLATNAEMADNAMAKLVEWYEGPSLGKEEEND